MGLTTRSCRLGGTLSARMKRWQSSGSTAGCGIGLPVFGDGPVLCRKHSRWSTPPSRCLPPTTSMEQRQNSRCHCLLNTLKRQAGLIGEFLQFQLPQPDPHPVGTPAVGGDHWSPSRRIALAPHLLQPGADGVDGELSGVIPEPISSDRWQGLENRPFPTLSVTSDRSELSGIGIMRDANADAAIVV